MALRHIETVAANNRAADVYRYTEWQEYRVKFARDGKELTEAAYFTDDKTDALGTARHFVETGL